MDRRRSYGASWRKAIGKAVAAHGSFEGREPTVTTGRRIIIRGRVQGVGYRAWLAREAERFALAGWVRNRRDGSVEAWICGPEKTIALLIEASHDGPLAAGVDEVIVHLCEANPLGPATARFEVLPTA